MIDGDVVKSLNTNCKIEHGVQVVKYKLGVGLLLLRGKDLMVKLKSYLLS